MASIYQNPIWYFHLSRQLRNELLFIYLLKVQFESCAFSFKRRHSLAAQANDEKNMSMLCGLFLRFAKVQTRLALRMAINQIIKVDEIERRRRNRRNYVRTDIYQLERMCSIIFWISRSNGREWVSASHSNWQRLKTSRFDMNSLWL